MKSFIKNPFIASIIVVIIFALIKYQLHSSIDTFTTLLLSYMNLSKVYGSLTYGNPITMIPYIGSFIVQFFLFDTWIFYIFPMFLISLIHNNVLKKEMNMSYITTIALTFAFLIYFPSTFPLYSSFSGILHVVSSNITSFPAITFALPRIIFTSIICLLSLIICNKACGAQLNKIEESSKATLILPLIIALSIIILIVPAFTKTINYMQCDPGFFSIGQSIKEANHNSNIAPTPIGNENKWGYRDNIGNIAINAQYTSAKDFGDGLAAVSIDGIKWGFINESGKMVINPIFVKATIFSEGLACISMDGKKWGFINKAGNIIIKPQFDEDTIFSEGLAVVKIGNKYGYIDKTGKIALSPKYFSAGSFHEGLANISNNGSKWVFINKVGQVVINSKLDKVFGFKNGMATIYSSTEWSKIDKTGKTVCGGYLPPKY